MTHPNDMSGWEEIGCRRGHDSHAVQQLHLDLRATHRYADLPQIPIELAVAFDMLIWDPARHPVDGGPYCVDAETEALTLNGWRRWSDLRPGHDALYGYDIETGLARWCVLTRVTVLPDEERDVLVMEGRHHSSVTTAEHRWVVHRRRQTKRYSGGKVTSITEVAPTRRMLPSRELAARDSIPTCAPASDVPLDAKWSDAFVELVAWFWTEGHIRFSRSPTHIGQATSVRITQSHRVNSHNVARIRACLSVLFGPASRQLPQYRVHAPEPAWTERAKSDSMTCFALNRSAIEQLLAVAPNKVVTPSFVLSLTRAQLQLFTDISLAADGSGSRRIAQRSRSRLEAMQLAWTLLGERTCLRYKSSEDMWWLTINARPVVQVAGLRRRWERRSGTFWCPTVDTGTWLARRAGHVFFTGNCPAHDAVSETLVSHRIWEPRETILTLTVCSLDAPDGVVLDMGAQLGWFSLLAAASGRKVHAFEADPLNLEMIQSSRDLNGWHDRIQAHGCRIGPTTTARPSDQPVRFAKLDLEGAEPEAIQVLWPAIEAGHVDHLMVEISPVFHDGYPDLVDKLVAAGYEAYVLPPKQSPPHRLERLPDDMDRWRIDTLGRHQLASLVRSLHQEDFWFRRVGACW